MNLILVLTGSYGLLSDMLCNTYFVGMRLSLTQAPTDTLHLTLTATYSWIDKMLQPP